MKVEFKKVHCVCAWSWDIHQTQKDLESTDETYFDKLQGGIHPNGSTGNDTNMGEKLTVSNEEDEEDVCGICRVSYNGTCPQCVDPGKVCSLVVGECNHVFHLHCIVTWLEQPASRGLCPMCRQFFTLKNDLVINKPQIEYLQRLKTRIFVQTEDAPMDDF